MRAVQQPSKSAAPCRELKSVVVLSLNSPTHKTQRQTLPSPLQKMARPVRANAARTSDTVSVNYVFSLKADGKAQSRDSPEVCAYRDNDRIQLLRQNQLSSGFN